MKDTCPYCIAAMHWMDALFAENVKYRELDIKMIDEIKNPEKANKYNYFYVPTYYVGDKKVHEGAASLEIVRRVFDKAINS